MDDAARASDGRGQTAEGGQPPDWILTETEQAALLKACPKVLGRIVRLALITGARIGELLALKWEDITDTELFLLETKNGRTRRLSRSPAIDAALKLCPKGSSTEAFVAALTRGD